ncbi:5474_t:CDS:1 [Cetraspora pellucida]|nr:5474_t:CDS:1 [Cetraspora pellucida]
MQFHFKDIKPKSADLPARIAYSRIDSIILKPKHAAVISNWIERKESPFVFSKKNVYQFDLIYRGTRDGFSNGAIINRCQNYGAYVVVIKIRGCNKVVGGYNSLGYRRSMNNTQGFQSGFLTQMEWKYSLDSFLFYSDDMKNIKTMHLSRVSTPNQAHYASTHHAVNFGNSDLICNGLSGSCYKNYYQYRLLESEFTTEEIEIFAVNSQ